MRAAFGILSALLLAAALIAPGVGLSPDRAAAQGQTCFGLAPTIESSGGTVYGTGGPDVIIATGGATIYGLGGDDVICAPYPSTIYAGSGNDRVRGAPDVGGWLCADVIFGGSGDDYLVCGQTIYGDSGNDFTDHGRWTYGGSGNDVLTFGDELYGGSGNDTLDGAYGVTVLCDGGSGVDTADDDCPTVVNVP